MPGWLWKKANLTPWTRVLSGLLIVAAIDTYAEDTDQTDSPSLELLEYLSTMVAAEDGWVGPDEFSDYEPPEQAIIMDAGETAQKTKHLGGDDHED